MPNDINKHASELTFGDRLRAVRKARGFTQVQLSAKSGVGQCSISSYEQDFSLPSLSALEWLCIALDVSASELLGF